LNSTLTGLALVGAAALLACRGQTSREPPLWIKHGMEFQARYNAYEGNTFYADGRNMRMPPSGTVARGLLKEDDAFYRGGDSAHPVAKNPLAVNAALLERGRERYDIYCSPCHARTGLGDGMVVQRGFLPPPSFHDARIVALADGQIFQIISGGIRNMPAYAKQIPEADRWAIVAYLRALQRSQRDRCESIVSREVRVSAMIQ
jgi:mono/diheme cytochrome c family protein